MPELCLIRVEKYSFIWPASTLKCSTVQRLILNHTHIDSCFSPEVTLPSLLRWLEVNNPHTKKKYTFTRIGKNSFASLARGSPGWVTACPLSRSWCRYDDLGRYKPLHLHCRQDVSIVLLFGELSYLVMSTEVHLQSSTGLKIMCRRLNALTDDIVLLYSSMFFLITGLLVKWEKYYLIIKIL